MLENRYAKRFGSHNVYQVPRDMVQQEQDDDYDPDMERPDYFGNPRPSTSSQRFRTTQSHNAPRQQNHAPIGGTQRTTRQRPVVYSDNPVRKTEKIPVAPKGQKKKAKINGTLVVGGALCLIVAGVVVKTTICDPIAAHWHEGDNKVTVTEIDHGQKDVIAMTANGEILIIIENKDGSKPVEYVAPSILYDKQPHEVEVTEQDVTGDGKEDLELKVDGMLAPTLYNNGNGYQWTEPGK